MLLTSHFVVGEGAIVARKQKRIQYHPANILGSFCFICYQKRCSLVMTNQ